jgi:hypothetical protein
MCCPTNRPEIANSGPGALLTRFAPCARGVALVSSTFARLKRGPHPQTGRRLFLAAESRLQSAHRATWPDGLASSQCHQPEPCLHVDRTWGQGRTRLPETPVGNGSHPLPGLVRNPIPAEPQPPVAISGSRAEVANHDPTKGISLGTGPRWVVTEVAQSVSDHCDKAASCAPSSAHAASQAPATCMKYGHRWRKRILVRAPCPTLLNHVDSSAASPSIKW